MHTRLNLDQTSRCSNTPRLLVTLLVLVALAGLTACERDSTRQQFIQLSELPLALSSLKREATLNQEPVRALEPVSLTAAQSTIAALGEKLFHDTRLSGENTSWPVVIEKLSDDGELVAMFEAAFGHKQITAQRVALAIASFERTLITPSPFDSYLKGDKTAISQDAASGYHLFKEYGCVACHQGVNLGGNLMQYFGAFHSIDLNGTSQTANQARNAMPLYKVPTLRNVALTAPYFHTGSVSELSDAVRVMGSAQLGRVLSPNDVRLLVAFLESLSGEVPVSAQPDARMTPSQRAS